MSVKSVLSPDAASPERVALYNDNKLKLGIFGSNCSSGRAATTVPERWSGNWEDNLALAQLADDAGMDFMLPIGRWRGYGGETNFEGANFETITWATGLLAQTKRLNVFGTVHAPLIQPIFAAKQFVTADHVGRGRFGLNIVCGWNQDEFNMFGVSQRDHEQRYAYGRAWLDIVKGVWTSSAEFNVDNEFFHMKDVIGDPKPYGDSRPVVMNAGASPVGREFGVTNCDLIFTPLSDLEAGAKLVREAEARAKELGKSVRVACNGFVVCRPTRREAEEYLQYYAQDNADWDAVDTLMRLNGLYSKSYEAGHFEKFRNRWAAGHGGYPLVGSPDDVADGLAKIHEAGYYGFCFSFVNYLAEFPYFRDEVLPRLVARGIRSAPKGP
jgi:alkanesulfonate monooxygenase SsuD/methylene tetrahydromethanopterin reductase-like flavin-dependent oxidoreductase (luciferase family)